MKKCFIVTWFNMGRNYGQTLQALAMQTILSRMNLNTQILNYCSTSIIYPCNIVQKLVRNIFIKKENWKLQREFDEFVKKHLKVTKYYCNYNI